MSDWNTSIIEEFRASGGKVGGQFEGSPLILIHHIAAKSGTEPVTPVGCFPQSDGRLAIIASNGGAPTNPDWYYNLKAGPEINVEFSTETFAVAVRELEGVEREKCGRLQSARPPSFANTRIRRRGRSPFCCSRGFAPTMFRTLPPHVRSSTV